MLNSFVILSLIASYLGNQATMPRSAILLAAWTLIFFPFLYLKSRSSGSLPPADIVSAVRVILVLLFYALVFTEQLRPAPALFLVLLIEFADFLDGWLARHYGITEFGGIWDMECDAIIIMLLSFAVVLGESKPDWMLIPGAIRYIFFLLFLKLKSTPEEFPLSLSWFSRIVCVATVFSLASIWYLPEASTIAIAIITGLLGISFLWESGFYLSRRIQTFNR